MMENITVVTTCMQRLEFLKRCLPTWIQHTPFDIIVVDYSCPEGAGQWVESTAYSGRITVIRQEAQILEGRRVFNPSRARNAGAAAVRKGYVLFLDADVQVTPDFQAWVEQQLDPEAVLAVLGKPSSLFGVLGVHVNRFREAGAYDESFTGWGGEDLDLRLRLHLLGLACRPIPDRLLVSLPHSNELRSKNFAESDFTKARQLNELYLHRKTLRLTGRRFRSWADDLGLDLSSPFP